MKRAALNDSSKMPKVTSESKATAAGPQPASTFRKRLQVYKYKSATTEVLDLTLEEAHERPYKSKLS
jgi:hypothetical protein